MTAGVYAIRNTADGMAYVGSSRNIEKRWSVHRSFLKHGRSRTTKLTTAWRAVEGYGFDFIILEETSAEDARLVEAEQRWLERFSGSLYNTRPRADRPAFQESPRNRIREFRMGLKPKMTQVRLAQLCGVTHQMVSQWERQINQPRYPNALRLCEVFGLGQRVDRLFYLADDGANGPPPAESAA